MKKVLLALVISSGFSLVAGAQSKFSLGPNAGVGGSWISKMNNSTTKLAGNVGLSLVYSAAEHFGIGVDTKYSFEGGKSKSGNNEYNLDLNYVRIPVKAIYFFNSYGNKLRPKVAVGPSFGFLTSANASLQTGNAATSYNTNVKSSFNSFDFGVLGSVGLNYRLVKNTWLNADVSYVHGISDLQPNTDMHNRNLGVNVGVNFGL